MSHEPTEPIALQELSATAADPTLSYAHPQDGTDPAKSTAKSVSGLAPPHNISRYEIRRELGRGGFGVVYLAYDPRLDREVALKVPRDAASWSAKEVDALLEEARTAAQLKHPHVITIYDVGLSSEAGVFIAMEYVEGQSLAQRLQNGPLPAAEATHLLSQVAEAVQQAHKRGLIHRDLKPSNILLDREGNAKVSDFGLALWEDRQQGHAGSVSGTLAYMSPEQIRGQAHLLDGRCDVWSLGVMLYECLGGRKPFRGNTAAELRQDILQRDPKPLRQIDESIRDEFDELCRRCLQKDLDKRLATAADFRRRLMSGSRPSLARRSAPLLMALALLAVFAVAAAAWRSLPYLRADGRFDHSDLLSRPPVALVFDDLNPNHHFAYSEARRELWVESSYWSAFTAASHPQQMRLNVATRHFESPALAGAFWGLHPEPLKDGRSASVCLAVVLQPAEGLDNAVLRLYRLTFAINSQGRMDIESTAELLSQPFSLDWDSPVDLDLRVDAGRLTTVKVQGDEVRLRRKREIDWLPFSKGSCGIVAAYQKVVFTRAMLFSQEQN